VWEAALPRVYFFAGPRDTQGLAEFFQSKGMHVVPAMFDESYDPLLDDLAQQPGCCLSPVPYSQLVRSALQLNPQMHPNHRNAIGLYSQPVITWRRSHRDGHYLIAGDLEWVDWEGSAVPPKHEELRRLNAFSGRVFRSARRWIHKNWTKDDAMFWHGPHAVSLEQEGLRPTSFHPEKTIFSTIFVDKTTGEQTEVISPSFEEWSAMKQRPKPH
jgi:hypothetical protein